MTNFEIYSEILSVFKNIKYEYNEKDVDSDFSMLFFSA
jgi:hypothetical protein